MQSKLWVVGAIATALLASACGDTSPSTGAASPAPTAASSPAGTGAIIAVATNAKLGKILVDRRGVTLYLFVVDTGTTSTCYTACAALWPPVLTTGAPQAGAGADASLLGTTPRTGGNVQVTYAGHPLYYFVPDTAAGDAMGQGVNSFGGLWWVLSPSGAAIH